MGKQVADPAGGDTLTELPLSRFALSCVENAVSDMQKRLSELEQNYQQILRSVMWWKRISVLLGMLLISVVCIAAEGKPVSHSFDALTVRELHVADVNSPYGMLLSAQQDGASILISKAGEQAPKQSVYLGVGGKGEAAVGVQAEGFNIIIGHGSPSITVQDVSVPGQPKTARLVVE